MNHCPICLAYVPPHEQPNCLLINDVYHHRDCIAKHERMHDEAKKIFNKAEDHALNNALAVPAHIKRVPVEDGWGRNNYLPTQDEKGKVLYFFPADKAGQYMHVIDQWGNNHIIETVPDDQLPVGWTAPYVVPPIPDNTIDRHSPLHEVIACLLAECQELSSNENIYADDIEGTSISIEEVEVIINHLRGHDEVPDTLTAIDISDARPQLGLPNGVSEEDYTPSTT